MCSVLLGPKPTQRENDNKHRFNNNKKKLDLQSIWSSTDIQRLFIRPHEKHDPILELGLYTPDLPDAGI